MRRWAAILGLVSAGCSTAPLAGFLDTVAPAKMRQEYRDGIEPSAPPSTGGLPPPRFAPQSPPPTPPPGLPQPPPLDRSAPFSPPPITVPNT